MAELVGNMDKTYKAPEQSPETLSKAVGTSPEEFDNQIHRLGKITTVIALLMMLAVPAIITYATGTKLSVSQVLLASSSVLMTFGAIGVTEVFSYAPILGPGGTYLAFITGNISNMKLPAATTAFTVAEVEPGTKEGEVVSMIAVAVSSLVTVTVVFIGMLFGSQIVPVLDNPILKPGFDYLIYALFGAFATPIIMKSPKMSVAPVLVMAAITLILGVSKAGSLQVYILPLLIIFSVAVSYGLFKTGKLKK